MPLTMPRETDPADTTEEAVLALLKALYAEAEEAGDTAACAAYDKVAAGIGSGEHWNQPGQSV